MQNTGQTNASPFPGLQAFAEEWAERDAVHANIVDVASTHGEVDEGDLVADEPAQEDEIVAG